MLELHDFIQLYNYSTPHDGNWNGTVTLPPSAVALLRHYWKHCELNPTVRFPEVVDIEQAQVFLGASDAEGGTNKGVGFLFRSLQNDAAPWSVVTSDEVPGHGFEKIVLGEKKTAP